MKKPPPLPIILPPPRQESLPFHKRPGSEEKSPPRTLLSPSNDPAEPPPPRTILYHSSPKRNKRGELLIDWDAYLVRSEMGSVLQIATEERFADHLNHYLYLQRTGYEGKELPAMGAVDWSAIVSDEEFQNAKGKFDPALAVDWFKRELTEKAAELVKQAEHAKERDKNRVKLIHAQFDAYGEEKIPEAMLVQAVLGASMVPIRELDAEKDKIISFLHNPAEVSFASYSAGPSSGIVRVLLPNGKPTKFYSEMSIADKGKLYYHQDHTPEGPTRATKSSR